MGMTEELARLAKLITETKTSLAQYEGRESEITERLKKTFGVNSVEEGDVMIEKLNADLTKMNEEIVADFGKLKEAFEW
jgi:hypothetical protein